MGLDPTDRKLLFGALALMLLMTALTATFAPMTPSEQSPIPSSYSAAPGGALAAYSLLERLHYPVVRWEETPGSLPPVSAGAVLILAEPAVPPTRKEQQRLRRFISGGGRIVFCGRSLPQFFPDAPLITPKTFPIPLSSSVKRWIELSPIFPSFYTRGAKRIRMICQASWKNVSPSQIALYTDADAPAVVLWRLGQGELLWWASATPLTNAEIANDDDMTLFLNAATPQGAGRIYWDEYFHGGRGTLWSYVERTPLKWAFVQCVVLLGAIVFAFSRRSGPIAAMRPVSRLSPLEFVETLGGLYQRAAATSVPIDVAYRHLRLALSRRLQMPDTLSNREFAQAAEQRLGWDSRDFTSVLSDALAQRKLRPKDALHLVQKLGDYRQRLRKYSSTSETT